MLNGLYTLGGSATGIDGKQLELHGDFRLRSKDGTGGIWIDVSRHVIAEIEIERDVASAAVPVKLEPFKPDYSVRTLELMMIAEPIEMKIGPSPKQVPHADMHTMRFVLNYLYSNLPGFRTLHLIGSRATGVRSNGTSVREQSDHDFIAVIDDDTSDEFVTGQSGWSRFFNALNAERFRAGLGGIDLFIYKPEKMRQGRNEAEIFAEKAVNSGVLVAKR